MLETEELFELSLSVGMSEMINVGELPLGGRRIVPVNGGSFRGSKLNGEVLPGADWVLVEPDGSFRIDVRLTLKTDELQFIYMQYNDFFHASREVLARYYRGEPLAEHEYYLRNRASFETSAPQYRWLNHIISVGKGRQTLNGVAYHLYHVL
jgi:hypothetical protein